MTQDLQLVRRHMAQLHEIADYMDEQGYVRVAELLHSEVHELELLIKHMDSVHEQDRQYMERGHTQSFPAIKEDQ